MAIRIHDLYFKKDSTLVYDWRKDALPITLQFCKLEERDNKVNPKLYNARVYGLERNRTLCSGTYEECKKYFIKNHKKGYMQLQLQIGKVGYGMETYIDNKDDYYFWKQEQKRKAREKADESRNWRAGDAPWDAPGMSMSDFF